MEGRDRGEGRRVGTGGGGTEGRDRGEGQKRVTEGREKLKRGKAEVKRLYVVLFEYDFQSSILVLDFN